VLVTEDSDAHINSCNIHSHAGGGVYVRQNSTLYLLSTTIHDNTPGDGLDVVGNSLANAAGNTTIQDNSCAGSSVTLCGGVAGGIGVFVGFNSFASFGNGITPTNVSILNNQDIGILAREGGTAYFNSGPTQITVENHTVVGILLLAGGHLLASSPSSLIEGNGTANCASDATLYTPCGGIVNTRNSTIELRAGTQISGNLGPGILARFGAETRLNNVTVSNNSADGLDVQWMSTLDYGSGNTVSANGGASVSCDVESLVVGDLSGLSHVKCPKVEEPTH